jgi:signal transduction histidine kinase
VPAEDAVLLHVAHSLRGRLQALEFTMAGLVDQVAGTDGPIEPLVQGVQRSALNLQTLLENVLDAASIEANQLHLHRESLDLAAAIQEASLTVEPLLAPRGQRIELDLPTGPLLVIGDTHHLRQVLVNVLHNAIKYGPRDQIIRVEVRWDGPQVRLAVVDGGGAIPPEEKPRLFERFFRGSAAGEGGRGSGLGLTVARAIVEAHGGSIGVDSTPGAGTIFWFTLPIA